MKNFSAKLKIILVSTLCLIALHITVAHAALTDNLAAYWKLDETSGTRADSVGSSNLTSINGVTQATGKLNSAAQFTSSSSQYLSIADNTTVSVGDIDFTVAAWVYLDSKSTTQTIASHYFTTTNQRGWDLEYLTGTDRFRFTVSGTGDSTIASVLANNFGSPSTGTWYYVVAWHDSVNNTINIQVNNGSVDSAATAAGVHDSTGPLTIGALGNPAQYFNGRIDGVGLWKRVLNSTERGTLYSGGSGLDYDFTQTSGPVLSTISSGTPDVTSATITWTSDVASDSLVEYGLSSSYNSSTTLNTSLVTSHSVQLTGLVPNKTYHYRVVSKDSQAHQTQSTDQTFVTAASTTDLTSGLIAYWKLDESSGTRVDSVGSNNLTSNNSVGQAAGKLSNAASFTGASSQYLSKTDSPQLSVEDIDFSIAGWVYLDSKSTDTGIVSHYDTSNNQRAWSLGYSAAVDRFRFVVSSDGSGTVYTLVANNFGSPSTGTWYYVVAWHDSVNNTINIQVNNGSVDSAAWTNGVYNSSGPFVIGALSTPLQYLTGRVDSVGFWKKVLSSTERTSLYNTGDGLEYPFTPQDGITITTPVSYQVIQRSSENTADIDISGTYIGSPAAIEASWNGGTYTTIVSSPSGGTYTGTLSGQTAGQGTLTVRFTNDHSKTASKSYIGIGDIFVSAGQSNGSGRAINNQVYTHPTLKAALFGNDDTWKELVDPFDSMSNQVDNVSLEDSSVLTTGFGSAWPLVATYYLEDQDVPVAFIPTNKGGTSISEWLPNAGNHGDTTTLYGSMYRRIQAVGGAVKGVLFWQGENDVGGARATYLGRLQSFADSVYADFGVKVVPAQIGPYGTQTATNLNNIRLAQQDAWNAAGNVLPGPTLYDVDITDPDFHVHFKTDSDIQTAADRWWAAISKDYFNGPDGRGPRISSATYNTAKTEITLTFTDDSLPILPTTGIDPLAFTVKDNGVAQTISSAVRVSSSSIKLVLASPASGTITVSLGSGDTAKGKVVPTDSSAFHLPAEIFIDQPTTLYDPDVTPPTLSEVTPVSSPTTDDTPTYTFYSSESGTISYGGACSSATTSAVVGNNTIIFSSLPVGTYSNCTIIVTDDSQNTSSPLSITTFTITTSTDQAEPVNSVSGSIPLAMRSALPIDCLPGYNFSPSTGKQCPAVSPIPIPSGPLVFTRTLRPGMSGADVKALQQFLNTHGFTVSLTGAGAPGHETTLFGAKTKVAVQKLQAVKGLKADGIVGPMTRGYLN